MNWYELYQLERKRYMTNKQKNLFKEEGQDKENNSNEIARKCNIIFDPKIIMNRADKIDIKSLIIGHSNNNHRQYLKGNVDKFCKYTSQNLLSLFLD